MDAMDAIFTRRSIRRFTDAAVEDAAVEGLLRAAMAAPSAGNQQPWHFVVIRDRRTMESIMEVHPHASMLSAAPVCIAVLAELALERYVGYWVQDTSAAMQNLLLAARAAELGAVWLGIHPREERQSGIKPILALPDGVVCLGLVAVGHPAEPSGLADRFQPDRIHKETW
jgi:nitroreductase